jgi:hypothetical protein
MLVSWKVTVNGMVVEQEDEKTLRITVDALINEIRERWGKYSDIDLHIWRDNWSH